MKQNTAISQQQSSYRGIMKATSLFGGVQLFSILIAIIRSKFIAVLLGPAGMGIAGLLTSTIGLISGATNFGLKTSAIKNVAAANSSGDQTRIATIITVMRRWVWVTGLLGMILTLITAPLLSRLTFGNTDYTFSFIWISVSLLLTQLSNGQTVLLVGLRKIKFLAKASLFGSVLGLIITIPLYYFLGIKGIVPAIIVTSVITFAGTWYFSRKIEIVKVSVTRNSTIADGKEMLIMGFMISLSGIISLGASYIIRIFISHTGSVEQVGLYTAGFAIINTYVGLVFTAMGTDYYPRLSEVANDNKRCKQTINQQAEIALLILSPIILGFLVFIQWIVIILYSNKFIAVTSMLSWAALGMLFKAASWSIAYVLLAKGESKLFFWNELIGNSYVLCLNILGYYYMGLTGLGISFLLAYLLYLIQIFAVSKIKYQFSFDSAFIRIFYFQLSLVICCFLVVKFIENPYSWIIGIGLINLSIWYSYRELDKRLNIKSIVLKIKNRF